MDITLHFFFNLSLLIILLFLGILWIGFSDNLRSLKTIAILFCFASLIICFAFKFRFQEDILLDLRTIPFTIGGLYLGIGPIIGLFIIVVRGMYGINFGFFSTAIIIAFTSLIFWRMSPWFLKTSSRQRVIIATIMTFIVNLFPVILMEISQKPFSIYDVYFGYLIIQPIGSAMIAIIIEILFKTIYLRHHLVKTKRLEVVEKMAAAISHEIRNPLTAAIGFVQLMQDETISNDKRDQYLSILKSELNSAEKVIQNFLNYTNPQIERVESLNVNDELDIVTNIMQPLAKRNSVTIESKFSSIFWINGNRQSFHQCFVNIIKNSIEAMETGGPLKVEVESTQTNAFIRIHDTGKGMTQEQVERLGEPYYSTKGESGTGLGIMVSYNIIRALNGTINVKSEVGKGTTFEFSFPIDETK
ncbi:HAMP domain-containing histidine kinase [Bacillus sp. FJAT-49732]|uniref:histidine kinase n=1 Tax=Lederbergia citrisecunda TaxID=2833583 RepID=A0A942TKX7_9BACI|nr:HAMP domain-containing sensor histidine kinase [Lederbergia citrisecunda]MBS4200010.1 HAMP domain-containing histidine kinase [Lederbergia citrisecunda]